MSLCGPQNIVVVRAGIELEVTPSGIRKVDFAPVLNRIVIHTCTPSRRLTKYFFAIPWGSMGDGRKLF
jgi:hypothetical protein